MGPTTVSACLASRGRLVVGGIDVPPEIAAQVRAEGNWQALDMARVGFREFTPDELQCDRVDWRVLGSRAGGSNGGGGRYWYVVIALWVPALVTAVLPAVAVGRVVRRRWRHPGEPHACRVCGYGLRATPGRCPECGTMVTAAAR
ncbi:MAG TPA: hypothetical protein VEA69_05435 [Tepidisphaeraceae bacterium]|nr:hypothetical protein [Tepidisphaeraceae bacterium]